MCAKSTSINNIQQYVWIYDCYQEVYFKRTGSLVNNSNIILHNTNINQGKQMLTFRTNIIEKKETQHVHASTVSLYADMNN